MTEREDFARAALSAELARHARLLGGESEPIREQRSERAETDNLDELTPAELLQYLFGLSHFELDLLLLCAAVELDTVHPNALLARFETSRPSFSIGMAALPDAHWSALLPEAPLRRWHLIELERGPTLAGSPLRIDERVLHFLVGLDCPEPRLKGIVSAVRQGEELVPSHAAIAWRAASTWNAAAEAGGRLPVLQLIGEDPAVIRLVAARTAEHLETNLFEVQLADLPSDLAECERLLTLAEREALLGHGCLLLSDSEASERSHSQREALARAVIERASVPTMLAVRSLLPGGTRETIGLQIDPVTPQERAALWHALLGDQGPDRAALTRIAYQFDLSLADMRAAADEARDAEANAPGTLSPEERLWSACRDRTRKATGGLLERIEPRAEWDDLVLPETESAALRNLADQLRYRPLVLGDWGFSRLGGRGLGMTALFAGPSGTGKTFAAEVLARELKLDLYRIDLSAIVSKYIGETEKNLQQAFAIAEAGGAVLLFDEADALFGKRSEVKDSHDRHANIEVSYLLQKIEAFPGLAILTTNLKDNIDQAFLRRLRCVINFPFPGEAQRKQIWEKAFPREVPREGIDPAALAKLHIAGGSIRSIALNAAFLAAGRDAPLRMADIAAAARAEYAKLNRILTDLEAGGWG